MLFVAERIAILVVVAFKVLIAVAAFFVGSLQVADIVFVTGGNVVLSVVACFGRAQVDQLYSKKVSYFYFGHFQCFLIFQFANLFVLFGSNYYYYHFLFTKQTKRNCRT